MDVGSVTEMLPGLSQSDCRRNFYVKSDLDAYSDKRPTCEIAVTFTQQVACLKGVCETE